MTGDRRHSFRRRKRRHVTSLGRPIGVRQRPGSLTIHKQTSADPRVARRAVYPTGPGAGPAQDRGTFTSHHRASRGRHGASRRWCRSSRVLPPHSAARPGGGGGGDTRYRWAPLRLLCRVALPGLPARGAARGVSSVSGGPPRGTARCAARAAVGTRQCQCGVRLPRGERRARAVRPHRQRRTRPSEDPALRWVSVRAGWSE